MCVILSEAEGEVEESPKQIMRIVDIRECLTQNIFAYAITVSKCVIEILRLRSG